MRENYFLDDGAYLITKLLIKLAQMRKKALPLTSLIETLAEPAESIEFRLRIAAEDFQQYGRQVLAALHEEAGRLEGWSLAPDNMEGERVNAAPGRGDGWFLLRMSLHDPLMPLNIESDSKGGARDIADTLLPFLRKWDKLDIGAVCDYCSAN